jgi:V/A-type H+-transporting ATPase subunit I
MFFPQEMTELELVVPEKDLLAVTKILAGQGAFHQVDSNYLGSKAGAEGGDMWREHAAAYALLERQITLIMQAVGMEEGSPPPGEQAALVEVDAVRPLVERIDQDVKHANDELAAGEKKLGQLQNYLRQLEPIADVDLDMQLLYHPRYLHSTLGTLPVANVERLETSLSRVPFVLMTLQKDHDNAVVWLTGSQRNADILDRAARSAYLNPFELSEIHQGTPAEIIKGLTATVQNTQKNIETQKSRIGHMRDTHQAQLQAFLWQVRASRLLADAMARFGKLQYTYVIVGWVPSSAVEILTDRLKQVSGNIVIDATRSKREGHDNQNVPVSLYAPGLLGAFEMLVNTYATPRYEEIDPTILIVVTFPLLFGAMFGDVGHGLVLALLGVLLASKRVKALRSMAGLGTIVVACGLVATAFGFLYGSIFGFENVLPVLWLSPSHDMLQILGVAIGAGAVILSVGYLLNLYNAYRAKDWARLFFDPNGVVGLLLYWSLLGVVGTFIIPNFPIPLSVFVVLAVVGAIGIMFSEPLKHLVEGHRPLVDDVGMFIIQAIVELFEKLISLFSNSMSYVRVGAFAVAHAGLSGAVFVLATLIGGGTGPIGYWTVVVLGNIFIIGFEGLIVGIQTLRLHYYEFFSKFFTGGGMHYEPLVPARVEEKP